MYKLHNFAEDNLQAQHALISAFPLGLLITAGPDGPVANSVPFQLVADGAENGTLRCHLARANDQWRHIGDGSSALVVFQGPDSYVSPSWYETKRETGRVVPTWNYAMVQVRGPARVIDDPVWLLHQVKALTERHEADRNPAWAVSDAPEAYIKTQLRGIVGIEIEIVVIEGKWKVSQNRSFADRAGVAEGLDAGGNTEANAAMAEMVRRYGKPDAE